MKPKHTRLFVKPGCPWCEEVIEWLDSHGYVYETLDVIRNAAARAEMLSLTGQSKAPSIELDGHVLADFGADELEEWLRPLGYET
jgi:monothiol glutaredoxin